MGGSAILLKGVKARLTVKNLNATPEFFNSDLILSGN